MQALRQGLRHRRGQALRQALLPGQMPLEGGIAQTPIGSMVHHQRIGALPQVVRQAAGVKVARCAERPLIYPLHGIQQKRASSSTTLR